VKSSGVGRQRHYGNTCEMHRGGSSAAAAATTATTKESGGQRKSVACQTDTTTQYGDLTEAICSKAVNNVIKPSAFQGLFMDILRVIGMFCSLCVSHV
jgi:hypothetical protein